MLSSPVKFELGWHDPGSFHANVDALQAEAEGVCKLHGRHHLFIHSASSRYLKNTKNIIETEQIHLEKEAVSALKDLM